MQRLDFVILDTGVTHVSEIGMSRSADDEILALSLSRKAVVVTLDADFHMILAVSQARGPSVIRLRIQGLGADDVVARVQSVLGKFEDDLRCGCLVTVKAHKMTRHRLPVGSSD